MLLPKAIMSGAFGGALGKVAARKIRWCLTGLPQCIGGAGGVRLPVVVRCLWLEWSYGFRAPVVWDEKYVKSKSSQRERSSAGGNRLSSRNRRSHS